jgi:hypothetical protein
LPILAVGLLAGCNPQQPLSNARASAHDPTPRLIAEEDCERYLGTVISATGRTRECRYRLTNPAAQEVKILELINRKPCCGTVHADKTVLRLGDSAVLEVTLKLGDRFGNVTHLAEVMTDLPGNESILLRTSVDAVPAIRVADESPGHATILVGDQALRELELLVSASGTPSEPPLDLERIELRSTIRVRWTGGKIASPTEEGLVLESRRLVATLDPAGEPGERQAEIVLHAGNEVLLRHVVRWEIAPRLQVTPKMIAMRSGESTYRAVIVSRDHMPFRVRRTECAVAGVKCTASTTAAAITHCIEVEGLPPANTRRGVVAVFTDHPVQEKVDLGFLVID